MTAAEVLARELETRWGTTANWAEHILKALKANGYAVVKVPARNVADADCSGSCWHGEPL